MLRKYVYGGIPPTDPRILAMTDEQVDLEFEHLDIDAKIRNGKKEEYADPEFEAWNKEMDDTDSKLSYEYDPPAGHGERPPIQDDNEEDWEDM